MTFSYKVFAGCVSFHCHSFKQGLIEDYTTYVHVIYYAFRLVLPYNASLFMNVLLIISCVY